MIQRTSSTTWLKARAVCATAALPLAPTMAQDGKIDPVNMTGPDGKPLSKGEIKAIKDFQMLDFNKDGKISRMELALVPKLYAGFDEADTNKDNFLSLEEVRAFAIKYRARRDAAKAAGENAPNLEKAPK